MLQSSDGVSRVWQRDKHLGSDSRSSGHRDCYEKKPHLVRLEVALLDCILVTGWSSKLVPTSTHDMYRGYPLDGPGAKAPRTGSCGVQEWTPQVETLTAYAKLLEGGHINAVPWVGAFH